MTDELTSFKNNQGQPEQILLVDDNPTNLQVLYQTLDGLDYKLLIAKNGERALDIANKAKPSLILLDIMMPGIDGYEVCRRLKADPATQEIPVIFLSALGETKDKVQGLDLGAVDYITKPFQTDEVIARVNTHLTIHRLKRDLAIKNEELKEMNENLERKVAERSKQLLRSREAVIFGMAKLTEARDDDTGKHLERICKYVEILA
ncbi:MAG: response regulator, partial [Desulfobacterales bacterium]